MLKKLCYIIQKENERPVYTDAVYFFEDYNGEKCIHSRLTSEPFPKKQVDMDTDIVNQNEDFVLVNTMLYHTPELEEKCRKYVAEWKPHTDTPVMEKDGTPTTDVVKQEETITNGVVTPSVNKNEKSSNKTKKRTRNTAKKSKSKK